MIILIEILISILLLVLAKWTQDKFTKFDDDHELFQQDNPALGISKAAYYLGLCIALSGLFIGEGVGTWEEVKDFCLYGLLSLALINVATATVDLIIMKNFKIYEQICQHRNEGVAWVLAGSYISSAIILRGAMSGDDKPLLISTVEILAYFFLGQIILILMSLCYECIMPNVQSHLEKGNKASGISLAGYLVAVGIIMGAMGSGNIELDKASIIEYITLSFQALIVLVLLRKFAFKWIFANGHCLVEEIQSDQNRAAGWITAFGCIGIAILLSAALA